MDRLTGGRLARAGDGNAAPLSPTVMPGLVPGIHVPPPPRPLPARTAMPQDVDARNKSGHDERGVVDHMLVDLAL